MTRTGLLAFGAALLGLFCGAPARAQVAAPAVPGPAAIIGTERFASPETGFAALAEAARQQDRRRIVAMLGPEGRHLIESGDPVADRAALERFATAYAQAHAIQHSGSERATLHVGADAWPLPIPMVAAAGLWRFDTRAGADEILNRRIGANELATIQTLQAIVDAQDEYAQIAGRQGASRAYAQNFFSRHGLHDGLYWATEAGSPPSPLGPLLAEAGRAGYAPPLAGPLPLPYNGYFFRILDEQGPDAPGGRMEYVVNGRMIGGFGVVAWPAHYGVSGIMTFIVSHAGVVYQRDLGRRTTRLAQQIGAFNPGPGWAPADR